MGFKINYKIKEDIEYIDIDLLRAHIGDDYHIEEIGKLEGGVLRLYIIEMDSGFDMYSDDVAVIIENLRDNLGITNIIDTNTINSDWDIIIDIKLNPEQIFKDTEE